jgi:predicted kinase
MSRLILMVGLPRSGKSTWVKKHKANQVIVSADDLRYIVYNQRFWGEGEPLMWSIRGMFLKYLMQQGIDIIIDETNTTKERRKPIIKLAKEYGYYVVGNVVEGAWTDTCIARAKAEGDEAIIPVIERMAARFELPEKEEGFDELNMV